MSATNNITNNTFNILVISPHGPTGNPPVASNSSAPTNESPWENDKLILPCKTTQLPEPTDAPATSEESSYLERSSPRPSGASF